MELIVALVVLITIGVLAFVNIHDLQAANRDQTAKTDVNVIYYQLEAFHQSNGYYPENLDAKTLPGLDPEVLKDANGVSVNQFGSTYYYKPANCEKGKCKSYQLKADLEKEPTYVKTGD